MKNSREIEIVGKWCEKNKIALNVKKCKHMISGAKKYDNRYNPDIRYKDLHIGNVDWYMYFGIKLDTNLTFEKQLKASISKVNARLVTFAKTRKYTDQYTSSLIYKQTILPYFDYISSITESSIRKKVY